MFIEVKNAVKQYGKGDAAVHALDGASFSMEKGEIGVILGASGSGKSTLMNMLGGIDTLDSGTIIVDGVEISGYRKKQLVEYRREKIGFVFQFYNLIPSLTARENIETTIDIAVNPAIDKKELMDRLDITPFANRYPSELSGGQQQRVAIARAVVNEPQILLLDEPLGALDLKMRKEMQLELKAMHRELGITFIYVTHDQEEALTMSDKIVVMSEGKMQQIGTPEDIYNEPINAFVADFIGESNIFNGIVTGKLKARFCGGEFVCVDDMKEGTHITAVVRPEDVQIVAPENGTIRGTVTSVIFKGMHYEITIESGKNEIVAQSVNVAKVGQRVGITVEPDNIHLMITEDHTNFFKVEINKNKELEYNDNVLDVSLTDIIKGSYFDEDGDLVDSNGIEIDTRKIRVTAAIQPRDIRMTDEQEEGLVQGYISNLIYEGDHYSYVIHTDLEHDFVVDDEYLWNMDDQVGLIMPVDKMKFTVKR